MDAIFKCIQRMPDSDNKQLMQILFRYNRALQDKFATHLAVHLPSQGAYVPPSDEMILSWQKKEVGKEADYCAAMGLTSRQAETQFKARQVVLRLDKDFKDLDDDGTEDPRQSDRVEHRMDIKRTGLQNANDMLFTGMFEATADAPEFQFLHSLPFVAQRSLAPHYGAIVDEELDLWHRQPFGMLFHELAKARRTAQGASSQ